jgi:hypothetical protein
MTDERKIPDWIPEMLAAVHRRAARRERGEPPGPTVMYADDDDGNIRRVDSGADRSEMVVKIDCACGKTHERTIGYMSDDQIEWLLEHNESRSDADPVEIAELRKELARRRSGEAER